MLGNNRDCRLTFCTPSLTFRYSMRDHDAATALPSRIRVGALEGYRDLVFELGGDPGRILGEIGLDEALWQTPDALIPTTLYRTALNAAAAATGTQRFGLLLSQRQSLEKFGAVGYLMKHSPTLRGIVEPQGGYFRIHDSGTLMELSIENGTALWRFRLDGLRGESAIQQTELALGLALKSVRGGVGSDWRPAGVHFEHRRPAETTLYERIFRCPVYFDEPLAGLTFPAADLERPLTTSDPKLYRILSTYLKELGGPAADDFTGRVRSEVLHAIDAGRPSIAAVAESLGMSRSRLQRRLRKEGVSYRELLEDVRFGLARKYLEDTDWPLATITDVLGYADPAVFTRAFRRLAGLTPSEWRRRARATSTGRE